MKSTVALSYRICLVIALSFYLMSCDDDFNEAQFDEVELTRLLAGDSAKSWVLSSRPDDPLQECELDDQLNLLREALGDTLGYSKETGVELCASETLGIVEFGLWSLADNAVKDSLITIIDGDSTFHAIEFITSQTLMLNYQTANGSQQLTYSYTPQP